MPSKHTENQFAFSPRNPRHAFLQRRLSEAHQHRDENYYVGICCPCCVGHRLNRIQRELCGQPETNLTWANLFVNSNYARFNRDYVGEFRRHRIILVANNLVKPSEIAFPVDRFYAVGRDAWLHDLGLIDQLKQEIDSRNLTDCLFLFSAGPWANLAVHALWQHQPHNIYIDVGSSLAPSLGLPKNRQYQLGGASSRLTCVWDLPHPKMHQLLGKKLRQVGSRILHTQIKPRLRKPW